MDASSPFPGFVTFAYLAERAGMTPNHLRVTLSEKDSPRPEPSLRAGGMHLYNEAYVEAWVLKFDQWRAEAPARAAARRAERDARARAALYAESESIRQSRLIGAAAQQAFDAEMGEVEAMNRVDGPYRL